MDYDIFQEGDRVWSEVWGFAKVGQVSLHSESAALSIESDGIAFTDSCTLDGRHYFCRKRPRYVFHAVADTDEGMREVIARGEGLKRLVPRGRWPIEVGDRVLAYGNGRFMSYIASHDNRSYKFPVSINEYPYSRCGTNAIQENYPSVMRLYDGEEPFKDPCENMSWMMDEAVKADWTNKIKGKV